MMTKHYVLTDSVKAICSAKGVRVNGTDIRQMIYASGLPYAKDKNNRLIVDDGTLIAICERICYLHGVKFRPSW